MTTKWDDVKHKATPEERAKMKKKAKAQAQKFVKDARKAEQAFARADAWARDTTGAPYGSKP